MTTEELLKPRYKVIADYPFNKIAPVGEIISGDKLPMWDVREFPHLFKKLEWWEERKESEMPEYVKRGDRVYKVADANEIFSWGFIIDFPMTEHHVSYSYCLPATKEEYDLYNLKQQLMTFGQATQRVVECQQLVSAQLITLTLKLDAISRLINQGKVTEAQSLLAKTKQEIEQVKVKLFE